MKGAFFFRGVPVLAAAFCLTSSSAMGAVVALYYDSAYVETDYPGAPQYAEAQAVSNALVGLGHTVQPFAGTSDADFTAGLSGADVFLVPELEAGNLAADLGPAAIAVISNYVASGGGMILHGTDSGWGPHDEQLLNDAFGFAVADGGQASGFAALTNAADTAFAGGPAMLPNQSLTVGLLIDSLPPDSRSLYQAAGATNRTWVALLPAGSGRIVYLGWDWFDAQPLGANDGGWNEVLDRAIEEAIHALKIVRIEREPQAVGIAHTADAGAQHTIEYSDGPLSDAFSWKPFANPAQGAGNWVEDAVLGTTHVFLDDFSALTSGGPAIADQRSYRVRTGAPDAVKKIAVFRDANYVDVDEEVENVVFHLETMGHNVRSFGGTTLQAWSNGLVGAEALFVPELEFGDLAAALDGATENLIADFVSQGKCLILFGTYLDDRDSYFLNGVFGYSTSGAEWYAGGQPSVLTNESGSAFAGGPASVPANNVVGTLRIDSLPADSTVFYETAAVTNEAWVAEIREGRGRIIYLGWDWWIAPPQGFADGGWLEVLDRALQQCARKRVGYYSMDTGAGVASQVAPIEAAGHDPVNLVDLSAAELASIDVLFAQNGSNSGYGTEYLAGLGAIETAVSNGMVLVLHDRYVTGAAGILPGGGGVAFTRDTLSDDVENLEIVNAATLAVNGPGGVVTDSNLDNGENSSHGYAAAASLPGGGFAVLSRPVATESVTFAYPRGAGWVVYSTIPLDAYLGGYGPAAFRDIYAPNIVAFGAALP